RNTSCPIRRRAMKPSLSAWAKRNHGQKAIASTGKDLRTGLETFWCDLGQKPYKAKDSGPVSIL
ncbi:MAG TPA: hypothetical protein VIH87_07790, partial [Methylocella sp.]